MSSGRSTRRWQRSRVLLIAICLVVTSAVDVAAARRKTVRVDRASFASTADFFSAIRVSIAVGELLHRFRADFPQPPPLDIVVRAQNAYELTQLDESLSSAGCELVGEHAEVIVNPRILSGPRALNDAELRSLLGHELRHAYQFADGSAESNSPDIWRREIEAFEWEMTNRDPAVRAWYRRETKHQLELYRTLLRDD